MASNGKPMGRQQEVKQEANGKSAWKSVRPGLGLIFTNVAAAAPVLPQHKVELRHGAAEHGGRIQEEAQRLAGELGNTKERRSVTNSLTPRGSLTGCKETHYGATCGLHAWVGVSRLHSSWPRLRGEEFLGWVGPEPPRLVHCPGSWGSPALSVVLKVPAPFAARIRFPWALWSSLPFPPGSPFDPTFLLGSAGSSIICCLVFGSRFGYKDQEFLTLPSCINQNFRLLSSRWGQEKQNPDTEFTTENLVMTTLELFFAGTETVSTTLRCGILLLMKYPEIKEKVHKEIVQVIGRSRLPATEDRSHMPYTDAVIHEVHRFADVIPMSLPHITTQDVQFRAYVIPKVGLLVPGRGQGQGAGEL
ncbi:uncharacterized protein LOC125628482 [Caretta caretta]|uniref:uncharacterized protein LOC125628482 n=1 Tax=Caretta caretta TaxID=8467 RepID=UPI003F4BDE04